MKRDYEQPVIQEFTTKLASTILTGSHIGEGEEGQQGDVKSFGSFEDEDDSDAKNKHKGVWDDDWSE